MTTSTIILDSLGAVSLVASSVIVIFGGRSKENDKASNELIDKLTRLRETDKEEFNKRITVLEKQHTEDGKTMEHLAGQIDVLKSIPLVNIDSTLKQIAEFNGSLVLTNKKVLRLLQDKAKIDAEDRDVLTNQSKHIKDEVTKIMDKKS